MTENTSDEILLQQLIEKASKGDAAAQRDLGCKYRNGDGVAQDYSEAAKWYRLVLRFKATPRLNSVWVTCILTDKDYIKTMSRRSSGIVLRLIKNTWKLRKPYRKFRMTRKRKFTIESRET